MKKFHLWLFLSLFPFLIFAQEFENNRIIVFGEIETYVPADNAMFTFEVEGVGSTLYQAVDQARTKVKEVSNSLFKIGLTQRNLRTSFFHSGENFDSKAFLSSKRDYKAKITVTVSIDSLNLLEAAIIKVSEATPEKISNVSFSLKNYEQIKIDALKKAVLKAKEKADLFAKNLDSVMGDVLYIEELKEAPIIGGGNMLQQYPTPYNASSEVDQLLKGKLTNAGFYAEEIKLIAKVKVIIEIKGKNK